MFSVFLDSDTTLSARLIYFHQNVLAILCLVLDHVFVSWFFINNSFFLEEISLSAGRKARKSVTLSSDSETCFIH